MSAMKMTLEMNIPAIDGTQPDAYLWIPDGQSDDPWKESVVDFLRQPLARMYSPSHQLTTDHLDVISAAVIISVTNPETKQEKCIACSMMFFKPFPDCAFVTCMEGVLPEYRRMSIGTFLFRAVELSATLLATYDPFVCLNLGGEPTLEIEAHVDHDDNNAGWLTRWLVEKMGFTREHSFRDLEFHKALPNPRFQEQ
jgi:hypothetical protein